MKILLVLQFWARDKAEAMKRARLIADLQHEHCDRADFLFVSRFDCPHDPETVKQVSRKFNTYTTISKRRGTGWPLGCNDLFFGSLDWIYSNVVAGKIPAYKAILTFEADSCPLHSNWLQQLSSEWDAAGTKVYGPQVDPGPHINGNTMLSGDLQFLKWLSRDIGGCTPHGGWDFVLREELIKRGVVNALSMRSWWRCPSVNAETYEQLLAQNVCFLHGCKDDSLVKLVRQKFNLPPTV